MSLETPKWIKDHMKDIALKITVLETSEWIKDHTKDEPMFQK